MNTTIPTEELIQKVSQAAYRGEAAAFIGSGISVPSRLPDWSTLLRPMLKNLGVDLSPTDENLPLMAQHLVNSKAGNRGALVSQFKDSIQSNPSQPNHYHKALALSSIKSFWTTNYDSLLEKAYGQYPAIVRARDSDMSLLAPLDAVEIIKIHGCIDRSAPDELVITLEDYEDYFVNRPLISERLRNDLQRKTFFFAGYGYGDPNIANILVEARRLAQRTPKRRFLLAKRATNEPGQNKADMVIRQKLWALDLARTGIECALVDSFDEYADVLDQISLTSRGPTLYVTGSHKTGSKLAHEVGQLLAEQTDLNVVLLDGQSTGVSRELISAFVQRAAEKKIDFRDRLKFSSNPYASVSALSDDQSLMPILKEWRAPMLRTTHTVLAFDGGMGTRAEVELAAELGCRLVLVPGEKNGSSRDFLGNPEISSSVGSSSEEILEKPDDWIPDATRIVDWILESLPRDVI